MTTSRFITSNDLTNVLNEVLPVFNGAIQKVLYNSSKVSSGTIELTHPYTDFDYLIVSYKANVDEYTGIFDCGKIAENPSHSYNYDMTIYDSASLMATCKFTVSDSTHFTVSNLTNNSNFVAGIMKIVGVRQPLTTSVNTSYTAKIGQIIAYAGTNEPTGWLKCDGRAVLRNKYPDLFAVIGTTYGSGDGSTTFNLPDLTERFPVGSGTNYAVGSTGGEKTHTLTIDEMPSHRHNGMYSSGSGTNSGIAGVSTNNWYSDGYLENTGGGQAHNNMPPYLAITYLIYAGVDINPITPDQHIFISTADPVSGDGVNGDVWLKYEISNE
jgi:microcystin-dependent protein